MTEPLAALSASISQLVASATPLLSAIRIAPDRHVTGLVCQGGTVVTINQALPALDNYTIVLSNRLLLTAHPGPRYPDANLAVLRLDNPWPVATPATATPPVGSIVAVLGADADAAPTARLTIVHRFIRVADGLIPVLDLPVQDVDQGSLVLAADGHFVGLVAVGPHREATVIPGVVISRMLAPNKDRAAPATNPVIGAIAYPTPPQGSARRGWLGVSLQPITIPDQLVPQAGQASGRMVVSITRGGPAEAAGMRVGDVLLSLNGTSASGSHTLRAFLGGDRIGNTVEVILLRDGKIMPMHMIVAAQPA